MNALRFLVVGVGRMGTNHVRVLSEMPDVVLAAVCDSDRDLAEKTCRRFLIPHSPFHLFPSASPFSFVAPERIEPGIPSLVKRGEKHEYPTG